MAEAIGIIASAITVGASAAQLSLALFSVAQTLKHAPKQIAEIAAEFSLVSESMQTLADIIEMHQHMCKPALFNNTQTIILRYHQVDEEIKKLIDTPQKLVGLQWFIKKPKAKGLLKKVEGIKTALILELNIIRLAREEFARPCSNTDTDTSVSAPLPSRLNRFRKIVESDVQANRQVVEGAQQDDDNPGTREGHCTDAELDVWREGSYDTATWLYHLVFSLGVLEQSEVNPNRRRLRASVVGGSDSPSDAASTSNESQSNVDEKAVIVWGQQTEPSLVVDRLLSSWTTLSSDQITLTSANQEGDEWREDLLRMIEEAKKEDELSLDQWEHQNQLVKSDDEESLGSVSMPTYNFHSNKKNHRRRNGRRSSYDIDSWAYASQESPILDHTRMSSATRNGRHKEPREKRSSHEHQVRWVTQPSPTERPHFHPPKHQRQAEKSKPIHADEKGASYTIYVGGSSSSNNVPRQVPAKDTGTSRNPFASSHAQSSIDSGYMSPWHEPLRRPHCQAYRQEPLNPEFSPPDSYQSYPHLGVTPQPVYAPPPPLPPQVYPEPMFMRPQPQPPVAPQKQPEKTETAATEKAIITAIEKLLEKRDQGNRLESDDSRFLKLVQILTAQQEREAQNERERANAAVEAQMKLVQAAHDKDNERLRQLENLTAEQRQEQRMMQVTWKEERLAMDEKAIKQAQEARNLAKKEMAAVQYAKIEAERQTQERADARATEERRMMESNHKQQLQRYEDLLQGLREQQLKSEQDAQHPVRRTRMAEGNRSVDVTEYSTDKRAPPFFTPPPSLKNFQGGFTQFEWSQEQPSSRRRPPRLSRHDSFHGSVNSLRSSHDSLGTSNSSGSNETSKQLIVFPSKADRGSKRIAELQRSLTALGIDSIFEDPAQDHVSQLIPYDRHDAGDQTVRSTIFWEATMLSLGSELLLTMRQAGWRPTYTRTSEKGQTYFLGRQPVHTYFFSPEYKPQFAPSVSSSAKEFITIQKTLVEEDSLLDLGFQYQTSDPGVYILDGRLTYNDIENLVERSFLMREDNYRRQYRRLQWNHDKNTETATSSPYLDTDAPSLHTASSAYSGGDNRITCEDADTGTEAGGSSAESTVARSEFVKIDVHDFLVPPSEGSQRSGMKRSDVPALSSDESSVKSPSTASWASKSTNNPFRRRMDQAKEGVFASGPDSLSADVWGDPF